MSILEGIKVSKYEYVLWMDADGSMPAFVASQLIEKLKSSRNQVIIGSRFVKGGYKGINSDGNNSIVNVIKIFINLKIRFWQFFYQGYLILH